LSGRRGYIDPDNLETDGGYFEFNFAYVWSNLGLKDGLSPLKSTLYMVKIRTINALIPVVWSGLFAIWMLRF